MWAIVGPAVTIVAVAAVLYVILDLAIRHSERKAGHWRVRIWWEGDCLTHRAKSEQEGREWASCYPVDAVVCIEWVEAGRWPEFVAGRNLSF